MEEPMTLILNPLIPAKVVASTATTDVVYVITQP
jgi:hypothetical protein